MGGDTILVRLDTEQGKDMMNALASNTTLDIYYAY